MSADFGVDEDQGEELALDTNNTPGLCLRLPGQFLNLTALLYAKRFRDHGYKKGAQAAFKQLEEAGLGKEKLEKSENGATVRWSTSKYIAGIIMSFVL